uniref:Uncharacterized protein n=1 Tax=Tanacetum cinerariifolium TaxID=118510 RepID=A0A6L2PB64_TANCI|nr:hypothetical protein [Tanacetum cinerariifolium]
MEAGSKDRPPMLAPGNDIYSTVDACPNARKMWKAIERPKCNWIRYLPYSWKKIADIHTLQACDNVYYTIEFDKRTRGRLHLSMFVEGSKRSKTDL